MAAIPLEPMSSFSRPFLAAGKSHCASSSPRGVRFPEPNKMAGSRETGRAFTGSRQATSGGIDRSQFQGPVPEHLRPGRRRSDAPEFLRQHPGLKKWLALQHPISRDLANQLADKGFLTPRQLELAEQLWRENSPKRQVAREEAEDAQAGEIAHQDVAPALVVSSHDDPIASSRSKNAHSPPPATMMQAQENGPPNPQCPSCGGSSSRHQRASHGRFTYRCTSCLRCFTWPPAPPPGPRGPNPKVTAAIQRQWAARTPEQRREIGQRAARTRLATQPRENLVKGCKKGAAKMDPERRREIAKMGAAATHSRPAEARAERTRKAAETLRRKGFSAAGLERIRANSRLRMNKWTPAQRTEYGRKRWAGMPTEAKRHLFEQREAVKAAVAAPPGLADVIGAAEKEGIPEDVVVFALVSGWFGVTKVSSFEKWFGIATETAKALAARAAELGLWRDGAVNPAWAEAWPAEDSGFLTFLMDCDCLDPAGDLARTETDGVAYYSIRART